MDLDYLRSQIDLVDDELAELYVKRLELVKKVGEFKKQNKVGVEHGDREKKICDRLKGRFGEEYWAAIDFLYNGIFTYSKMEQNKLNADLSEFEFKPQGSEFFDESSVAIAGTSGAYAEQAAKKLFKNIVPVFYKHFGDVFDAVAKGKQKFGVVPIENSTAGSVNEVYDLLKEYNLKIVAADRLTVSHCLLGLENSQIDKITNVYSHPQALYQCKKFIESNSLVAVEESNTAVACEKISKMGDPLSAAIGSEVNAKKYGLKILKGNLQDAEHNFTRFIVISREMTVTKDADRLSLMVSIKHKPGTLFQLLGIVGGFGVNLLKLESRPIPDQEFRFMFYLDIQCDVFDRKTAELLASIKAYCDTMTVLGAYGEKL